MMKFTRFRKVGTITFGQFLWLDTERTHWKSAMLFSSKESNSDLNVQSNDGHSNNWWALESTWAWLQKMHLSQLEWPIALLKFWNSNECPCINSICRVFSSLQDPLGKRSLKFDSFQQSVSRWEAYALLYSTIWYYWTCASHL